MKTLLKGIKSLILEKIDILIMKWAVSKNQSISDKILIVKPNGVGDYILVRDFFIHLKSKFPNHKISYLGNKVFRDFAEYLDSDVIDEFIWIDKEEMRKSFLKKYFLFKSINRKGFKVAIHAKFSRSFLELEDLIVASSNANLKIAGPGDLNNNTRKHHRNYSKFYDQIIGSSDPDFEFYWNKDFFERIIGRNTNVNKPSLPVSKIKSKIVLPNEKFVVLFPGAGAPFRQWHPNNFAEIGEYLNQKFGYQIVIAGSPSEVHLANMIVEKKPNIEFYILSGKISLIDLVYVISKSDVCISNETAATHIAVAVNTPSICISNGNHFKRFNPYPTDIFDKIFTVYPDEISDNLDDEELLKPYIYGSSLDINSIKTEQVKDLLSNIILNSKMLKN